ncbi:hypothetical protein LHYA1_G004848 [Lachnellula hyalina]|uniref:Alginate lyase domain-containing protein n=1 Tax=Lachnellula hyalina TaxID=1316788 RepID=A0A8H8R2J7_9HELO|nr:uncharacterized protein LHYA1_G004848 [Lachnellula hyalina]TVY26896.1 hypothetical protein LHYA1_G004848 [Lachnellula hyalina]
MTMSITSLFRFLFFAPLISAAFVHPGLMVNSNDISRIKTKLAAKLDPWTGSYSVLTGMTYAQSTYTNGAVSNLTRATNTDLLWHDAAAAFALALRWKLEGDDEYAAAAAKILTAWGTTLESLGTDSDQFLTAGLQGFEMANAGELLRDYAPFVANGQKEFNDMMVNVFLAQNIQFIKHKDWSEGVHNHYFASWELCNMASAIAIAVLTDDQDTFDFVVDYWHTGDGNGAISLAISDIVEEPGTGGLESGTDLYADSDYRMLRGAEYFARYNLGNDVPFVPYANVICNYTEASNSSRGAFRPNWELLYSHYGQILGMDVPWVKAYLNFSLPLYPGSPGYEGGLGSWGEGSGHYDSLGWGSLLHHLDDEDVAAAKNGSTVAASNSTSSASTSSNSTALYSSSTATSSSASSVSKSIASNGTALYSSAAVAAAAASSSASSVLTSTALSSTAPSSTGATYSAAAVPTTLQTSRISSPIPTAFSAQPTEPAGEDYDDCEWV